VLGVGRSLALEFFFFLEELATLWQCKSGSLLNIAWPLDKHVTHTRADQSSSGAECREGELDANLCHPFSFQPLLLL
jgi:hypothetical protein